MNNEQLGIQFCGFGGQGVILASVIFGTAVVTHKNYFAVQTQSFGSEARGGECQAELVLSKEPIYSPSPDYVDILVGMSNLAFNRYLGRLKKSGDLLIDPDMIEKPSRNDCRIFSVEANRIAKELGFSFVGNMVFLGALQGLTQIFSPDVLFKTISENVSPKYAEMNIVAAKMGLEIIASQLKLGE